MGEVNSPGGTVNISTVGTDLPNRVLLDQGALVDVSGVWTARSAEDNTLDADFNSVELRDDFLQQGGVLQGANVTFDAQRGTNVADISGSLNSQELTLLEASSQGGVVNIFADSGEIVTKESSEIRVNGGGTFYGEGIREETIVRAGNSIFSISEIPTTFQYDQILNQQSNTHVAFGITDTFNGIFGRNPAGFKNRVSNFIEGDDAGFLNILGAKAVILNGNILGRATRGIFQTLSSNPSNQLGDTVQRGLRVPQPMTLSISEQDTAGLGGGLSDHFLDRVVISNDSAPLAEDFSADPIESLLPSDDEGLITSFIPASVINNSGASSVRIFSNTEIISEKSADIVLQPFERVQANGIPTVATLSLDAAAISLAGDISVPGGNINISLESTILAPSDSFVVKDGTVISAAGQELINFERPEEEFAFGYLDAGSITLSAFGQAPSSATLLDIGEDVVLDVRGGYEILPNGSLRAGEAGLLSLGGATFDIASSAQLLGHSLPGTNSGQLLIRSSLPLQIVQSEADVISEDIADEVFAIALDRFEGLGFSELTIGSQESVVLVGGTVMRPSLARRAVPAIVPGSGGRGC